ncbi:MAG: hypothetical protein M3297_16215 [Thermoproteota archaeon]|jgi:hypothetical protein|nr:hypothetical protein [Thermoproteota archaeon]
MKTSFREDIELEDHEHKFELADITIKFRNAYENDNFIWAVCENCHEFKRNVTSAELESWYEED